MEKKVNKLSVILGKRATGKTHLTKEMVAFRPRVIAFDTIREFDIPDYEVVTTLEELERQMQKDTFRVRVWDEYNEEEFFDKVCELVNTFKDLIFIIDEVDQYCGASFCSTGFKKLINYGRHQSIEIICTARSPAEIPKMLIGQTTDLYFFRIMEPNHLKSIGGIYDGDVNDIKSLPNHEHIHFET